MNSHPHTKKKKKKEFISKKPKKSDSHLFNGSPRSNSQFHVIRPRRSNRGENVDIYSVIV